MLSEYFIEFGKKIKKKGAKGGDDPAGYDKSGIIESFSRIIPSSLTVDSVKPIDKSGFAPEGIDFIVYNKYCHDIIEIMNGYAPYELLRGTFFVSSNLDKKNLFETLNRIITVKKMDSFSEGEGPSAVPAFLIALDTKYNFLDLKNDILNYYISKSVDSLHELDLLYVVNKGLVIKNWREQRSYIALETGEDTNMWFYILMNEYLDVNKKDSVDFRHYVKKDVIYKEY